MSSGLVYDKNGWLFENPQENAVHDISIDDINQLLYYAEQEDARAEAVKHALAERNEAIRNGIDVPEMDYVLEQSLMMPSKGHLFRGKFRITINPFHL